MVKIDIKKEIAEKIVAEAAKEHNITAVVMPHSLYTQKSQQIIEETIAKYHNICYITLNNPYELLSKKYKNDGHKFFFIDTVTKTVVPNPPKAENVVYIKSQTDFKGLKKAVEENVQKQHSEIAIFDNLSNLFVFQKGIEAINFAHLISASLSLFNCKGVFLCVQEDMEEESLQRLSLFVDKVVIEK